MKNIFFLMAFILCTQLATAENSQELLWDQQRAEGLAKMSLDCVEKDSPHHWDRYNSGIKAKERHPSFYGCYDWHSAVHGHWALLRAWKSFPKISMANEIEKIFDRHFTKENMNGELKYFQKNKNFENAYGYAWFFRLQSELTTFKHPKAEQWLANFREFNNFIIDNYSSAISLLNKPVREGTHDNTAYAMIHAYDFSTVTKNFKFQKMIIQKALEFYKNDIACPINYEPGPYDFISPCLIEADLMRRVLPKLEFEKWEKKFFSQLNKNSDLLKSVDPKDPKDSFQSHQIGLMFQKAASLYGISENLNSKNPHKKLFLNSIESQVKKGNELLRVTSYEGGLHWVASFAIYYYSKANILAAARGISN